MDFDVVVSMRVRALVAVCVSVVHAGCLSDEISAAPMVDAAVSSSKLEVIDVLVRDDRGRRYPLDEAPRRPILELQIEGELRGDPEPVVLLEGAPDDALTKDLSRSGLSIKHMMRMVDSDVARHAGRIELRARRPLRPGHFYSVAVGAWAGDGESTLAESTMGEPFVRMITIRKTYGGAVPVDSWPADGASGVPTTLALAAVHFDDEVREYERGVTLENGAGESVSSMVRKASCETIGWNAEGSGAVCVVLEPQAVLAPDTLYRIVVDSSVVDRAGSSVGPWSSEFRTSAFAHDAGVGADGGGLGANPSAIQLIRGDCSVDEEPIGLVCALIADTAIAIRTRADRPVRAFLRAAGQTIHQVAPRGDLDLTLSMLDPNQRVEAELELIDLSGQRTSFRETITTRPTTASIAITEVRADPAGPEPQQEYVELFNFGREAIDLLGFSLSDDPDRPGDEITQSIVIHAQSYALLVPEQFDDAHPLDVQVPPGVTLIRIDRTLGSGGLSNRGEPLFLRDADGQRISSVPAIAAPGSGVCLVRLSMDFRSSDEASFGPDPDSSCTPGRR